MKSCARPFIIGYDPAPGKTGVTGVSVMVSVTEVRDFAAISNPTEGAASDRIDGVISWLMKETLAWTFRGKIRAVFVEEPIWNPRNRNAVSYGQQHLMTGQLAGFYQGYGYRPKDLKFSILVETLNPVTARKTVLGAPHPTAYEIRNHILCNTDLDEKRWKDMGYNESEVEAVMDATVVAIAGQRLFL